MQCLLLKLRTKYAESYLMLRLFIIWKYQFQQMYSLFPAHIDGISAEFTIAGHLLPLDLPTMLSEEGIWLGRISKTHLRSHLTLQMVKK